MKKFLFSLPAMAIFFLISCTDKKSESGGLSATAQKNLDAYHAITKMFENGDWSKCGDYIATDAVDHGGGDMGEDIKGLDNIKAHFDKMGTMAGNMKNKFIKEFADDEYVMAWMDQTMTAKVDAPEMGMKKGAKKQRCRFS